jgi:hypothetical protein
LSNILALYLSRSSKDAIMSADDSFADEEFFSSPTSSLGSSSSSMKDDSSHFSSMED